MRVLVTGASGFIGRTLVPALVARGYDVRSASTRQGAIDTSLRNCDVLVHLANFAHGRVDPKILWAVNVEGTRNIAASAAAGGVRRMVFLSSIKASGEKTIGVPFRGSETDGERDRYGQAKAAAERAIAQVAAASSLETVVLRPPIVYGPHVRANFFALLHAIGRGWPLPFASIANRRSLIYVGNLADAVIRCIDMNEAAGRTYTLCDGPAVSTPELCEGIGKALNRAALLFPFPPALLPAKVAASLEVDDSAMRSELRWQPPFSMEQGLRATADWYRHR